MKKIILLIVTLISTVSIASSHKDITVYETYGNVRVYLKTGFNYSEIEKIKIIGKLSEKLCLKLSHKEPVFIEYIHDYTDLYLKDVYQFDNNTNWSFSNGLRSNIVPDKVKPGISIRINANKINIIDILSLVEYGITHKVNLPEKNLSQKVVDRWGDNDQELEFNIKSIPDELINEIFNQKTEIIKELISVPTYAKEVDIIGIQIYWINDKFSFEYKFREEPLVKLLEVGDFLYYLNLDYEKLLLFINEDKFYYAKPDDKDNNILLELNSNTYVPFNTISYFKNKIILYNNWNSPPYDFFILLTDKRKVLSKFE